MDDGQENFILDLQTKSSYNGSLLLDGRGGYGNHNKKDYNLNGNFFKTNGENVSLTGRSSNRNMTQPQTVLQPVVQPAFLQL